MLRSFLKKNNEYIKKIKAVLLYLYYGKRGNQLELVLPLKNMRKKRIDIPDGFLLRNYNHRDINGVLDVFKLSLFHGWNKEKLNKIIKTYVENGFFVVIDKDSNTVVATMAARHDSGNGCNKTGCITWLCTHPKYRGLGLGEVVASAAVNCLLNLKYNKIFVNTDDERLPAIKIFLKLGFEPLMYKSKMQNRWRIIMNSINNASKTLDVIPVYTPILHGNEKKYVNECLDDSWISSRGKFVSEFEKEFSDFLNVKYSTSVSNGTVALHLALAVLEIGEGDEVIVPTLTYIASVNAIAYVGAKPVFIDSHKKTWNIDPDQLLELITPKTKAIMVVHLYGNSCDMDSIVKICKERDIFLIEDAAEAFGTKYNNKYIGTFGDVATFSFFGNKTITTGEGGMLVTDNKLLIDKASHLKNQGVSSNKEYWHDVIGFNYRMTNICAAIGLAQLEKAEVVLQKKIQIASWYREFLEGVQVKFQNEQAGSTHSYWMVTVLVKNKNTRVRVRSYLDNHNVETRPVFYPSHKMPVFYSEKSFPVSESISDRGINLPSSPSLIKSDVKYICTLIDKAIKLIEAE